jgi:hypothetical protein
MCRIRKLRTWEDHNIRVAAACKQDVDGFAMETSADEVTIMKQITMDDLSHCWIWVWIVGFASCYLYTTRSHRDELSDSVCHGLIVNYRQTRDT